MAKDLPYFRWYPADAETDNLYASFTDEELGFFHRCLNRSWINGGIPADMDELAGIFRMNRESLDKLWKRVGRCWNLSDSDQSVLVNRRQEEERSYATSKSERNSNAVRSRYERRTNEARSLSERRTNEPQRAYGSVSVSESKKQEGAEQYDPSALTRFDEWWAVWSGVKGTAYRLQAEGCYVRVVPADLAQECLECTRSYLDSLSDPTKGYSPNNFLMEQARDKFQARWPKRLALVGGVRPDQSGLTQWVKDPA